MVTGDHSLPFYLRLCQDSALSKPISPLSLALSTRLSQGPEKMQLVSVSKTVLRLMGVQISTGLHIRKPQERSTSGE
jgi:hypothetical protein